MNNTEYKYYKIVRKHDNFTSYCSTLNFVYEYFTRLHGMPDQWIESEDKYNLKLRKDEAAIPLTINAEIDDELFEIVLSEQEYNKLELNI
ncbi:hypothetical protein M3649_04040 [Ureibacillus chungkukjangi]|uniref:hypothetical protein n=1 Tax=Ureibacillus chungkukjangi TaxID=1202712 RepID=UPI00203D9638|nr:hypothetical protein [Ureibacillus chungkukjangi]MCM3387303.1 hypothetical protein [Ureibacillus chungkukjangi]